MLMDNGLNNNMQPDFTKLKPVVSTEQPDFANLKPVVSPVNITDPVQEAISKPLERYNQYGQKVNESYQSGINQIKDSFNKFSGSGLNLVKAGEAAISGASGVVNTLLSPIAPLFEPVSKAVEFVGKNKLTDIPEVQDFARSKYGDATERVSTVISDLMNVAGAVGGAVELSVKSPSPKTVGKTSVIDSNIPSDVPPKVQKLIKNRVEELNKLDSQYAQLRKASGYSEDNGLASRTRVASTNVLDGAVDENGVIRTTQPNGPIDQYRAMTLDNAENVVRKNLEREGGKTNLNEVEIRLNEAVNNSGLEGADLKVALNKVKQEISGLKLKADEFGDVPNTLLQDAKISTTRQINYQTPPEVSTYRKAIANGYKTTIEKNSSFNVKEVNRELSKYLEDISFLERLDGKRVKGGKLGKYFAQIAGNIVGGAIGSAVAGPVGLAVGPIIGGELASRVKGSSLSKTFKGQGIKPPENPILAKAIRDAQLNKSGNLDRQYQTPNSNSNIDIGQNNVKASDSKANIDNTSNRIMGNNIPENKGIIKRAIDYYKSIPNKQGGFVKIGGKVFKEIPEATKKEMIEVIDYLNLKKPVSKSMESTIEKLLPKYNINQDWSNAKIADALEKLVENTKTK